MNFRYYLWAGFDSCLKTDLRSPGNFDLRCLKTGLDFDTVSPMKCESAGGDFLGFFLGIL